MRESFTKYIPLSSERWRGLAVVFLILGMLFSSIAYLFGVVSVRYLLVFGFLSLASFVVSRYAEPEQKEWICQFCGAVLKRDEIKFGVCPNCGTKVEGFRGMTGMHGPYWGG